MPKPQRKAPPAHAQAATACANCRQPLSGRFCPHCGQEAKEVRRPFYRIIGDALAVMFDLDSRAYTTLYCLLLRPAFLSREYVSGRRAAYTPPLRLFLVITISLFTIATALNNYRALLPTDENQPVATEQSAADVESGDSNESADLSFGFSLGDNGDDDEDTVDAAVTDIDADEPADFAINFSLGDDDDGADSDGGESGGDDDYAEMMEFIDDFSLPFLSPERNTGLREMMRTRGSANLQAMQDDTRGWLFDTLEYMAVFILLLMPVLALIQKIVFITSRRYYIEHLILTLHNHVFLLLAYFIGQLLDAFDDWTLIQNTVPSIVTTIPSVAWAIWTVLYLYLSMKNFFGGSHLRTTFQFLLISAIYTVVMFFSTFSFLTLLFFFTG